MSPTPPPDVVPLLDRPDLVHARIARRGATVAKFVVTFGGGIALLVASVLLFDQLDALSNTSSSRRGRLLEWAPIIFGVVLTAVGAISYMRRAIAGEHVFTFAPTGEPMADYTTFVFAGTPADLPGMAEAFRTGDPRQYTPLPPSGQGVIHGRILQAPEARVAIVTFGANQRTGHVPGEPIVWHGPAYERLLAVPRKELRSGKLSKRTRRALERLA